MGLFINERDTRIGLAPSPWKGDVLPLYESRLFFSFLIVYPGTLSLKSRAVQCAG